MGTLLPCTEKALRHKTPDKVEQVASSLGCQSSKSTFTSGGTEADNIAILGAARAQKRRGNRIVTTAFEHDAVLNTVKYLESEGWEIVRLMPDANGQITPEQGISGG